MRPIDVSPRALQGIDPLAPGDAAKPAPPSTTNRPNLPQEEIMKIPLAVALVGFAISFALPIFVQETGRKL
jgi:hypothetical protein